MVTIFQEHETAALREKTKPVLIEDITSAKVQKIIADMKRAMHSQDDAVAIAAPQIGIPLAIFIVSGKIFIDPEDEEGGDAAHPSLHGRSLLHSSEGPSSHSRSRIAKQTKPIPADMVVINPEIKKLSRKKELMEEGCLSVRWLYGKVLRSLKATIHARDERGMLFMRGASGLLAQIFQHEIDHLNGILFIDKATDVHEVAPEKEEV